MRNILLILSLLIFNTCNSSKVTDKPKFKECRNLMIEMFSYGDQVIGLASGKELGEKKLQQIQEIKSKTLKIQAGMEKKGCSEFKKELSEDSQISSLAKDAKLKAIKVRENINNN